MSGERVLVTGGTGFIAQHCMLQLLSQGYRVRATVRSLSREADVRAMLKTGGAEPKDRLEVVAANLLSDEGWSAAVKDCTFVLHVASPFPEKLPKHEDELIVPAREGTLRVLKAARDAGVKRVVLTSSFAAIGYGHPEKREPFTEQDWTDLHGPGLIPYVKSKTLAEKAAWEWLEKEGRGLELSVVNPVGVYGPVLGPDYSTSILVVQRMMDGQLPGCPRLVFGAVDVRDVADLHLRAMTDPAARGERFLAVAGDFLSMQQIAQTLKDRLGRKARRVSTRRVPDFLVRLISFVDPAVSQVTPDLGKYRNATSEKAKRVLGWKPRSAEDALTDTANSLLDLGLLKESRKHT